jgi:hypothetical protein
VRGDSTSWNEKIYDAQGEKKELHLIELTVGNYARDLCDRHTALQLLPSRAIETTFQTGKVSCVPEWRTCDRWN